MAGRALVLPVSASLSLSSSFLTGFHFSYLKPTVTTWTKESVGEGLPKQVKLTLGSSETS